mmetsp:Transcript_34121/g.71867  ORF Transcript_34121/g.71867 Transcript_34121/m.71867 type:complete len:249 (+) Transcript_34121:152-898(+)
MCLAHGSLDTTVGFLDTFAPAGARLPQSARARRWRSCRRPLAFFAKESSARCSESAGWLAKGPYTARFQLSNPVFLGGEAAKAGVEADHGGKSPRSRLRLRAHSAPRPSGSPAWHSCSGRARIWRGPCRGTRALLLCETVAGQAATHTRSLARSNTCKHARTLARTHARSHARSHTRTHARTYARSHTRTHTRTQTADCGDASRQRISVTAAALHDLERRVQSSELLRDPSLPCVYASTICLGPGLFY